MTFPPQDGENWLLKLLPILRVSGLPPGLTLEPDYSPGALDFLSESPSQTTALFITFPVLRLYRRTLLRSSMSGEKPVSMETSMMDIVALTTPRNLTRGRENMLLIRIHHLNIDFAITPPAPVALS